MTVAILAVDMDKGSSGAGIVVVRAVAVNCSTLLIVMFRTETRLFTSSCG
jgi:hypothetical protein